MSKNENIERSVGETEPLHPIAERAVALLVERQGPMRSPDAEELKDAIVALPDEELGDALFSIQRVAGYFHERLGAPLVAAQLMDLCFDMTHQLVAATGRLTEKRRAKDRSRQRIFDRMTCGVGMEMEWRAPSVGKKSGLSVNALRPKTTFR